MHTSASVLLIVSAACFDYGGSWSERWRPLTSSIYEERHQCQKWYYQLPAWVRATLHKIANRKYTNICATCHWCCVESGYFFNCLFWLLLRLGSQKYSAFSVSFHVFVLHKCSCCAKNRHGDSAAKVNIENVQIYYINLYFVATGDLNRTIIFSQDSVPLHVNNGITFSDFRTLARGFVAIRTLLHAIAS